ncbi:MAG: hypothetical protein GSR85_01725 [Desulfurococcales archaeon]|nr:hypothetical protein [Desulfurococcales archaeon]
MQRRILKKEYVTLIEASSLMKERVSYEDLPLTPEQERAWEYLKTFGQGDPGKAREAVDKLVESGLDPVVSVNLVNICPSSAGEVRLILGMRKDLVLSEELVDRVMDILKDVCRDREA